MQAAPLNAVLAKRFVATTDSNPALPVADNLLDRHFEVEQPNRKWTADISYVWTSEGGLYLFARLGASAGSLVWPLCLDLFSPAGRTRLRRCPFVRRIVGWAMGTTLERSVVLSALDMALLGRRPASILMCHSDRGSQYASLDYQKALQDAGIVCSMSRKGNCWDNAPTESFFATLKRELVHRTRFTSRSEARGAIFSWIATWYNRQRRHSSLGYMSPEAFKRQHQ